MFKRQKDHSFIPASCGEIGRYLGGMYMRLDNWKIELDKHNKLILHNCTLDKYSHKNNFILNKIKKDERLSFPNGCPFLGISNEYRHCEERNFGWITKYSYIIISYFYDNKKQVYYFMDKYGHILRGNCDKNKRKKYREIIEISGIGKLKKNFENIDNIIDKI